MATTESYRGVLDLGTRLGAHFVTAGAVPSSRQATAVPDLFGQLVEDCDAYQLIRCWCRNRTPASGPPARRWTSSGGSACGVMINLSTGQSAVEIESLVIQAGIHLGYLRLLATDLDEATDDAVAGLMATVPVHVPIAVGSAHPSGAESGDLLDRARRWYRRIDAMLEHPRARAERGCTSVSSAGSAASRAVLSLDRRPAG